MEREGLSGLVVMIVRQDYIANVTSSASKVTEVGCWQFFERSAAAAAAAAEATQSSRVHSSPHYLVFPLGFMLLGVGRKAMNELKSLNLVSRAACKAVFVQVGGILWIVLHRFIENLPPRLCLSYSA